MPETPSVPPEAQLMQMASAFTGPFLLRAAAQLRLADHLASSPKTAEELAPPTGTHAPALYRLLRTLASHGIFSEDEAHRFSLTALSMPLRSDIPGSVRTSILSLTGDLFILPWSKLEYSVKTGKPSFDHHFGQPFFDYITNEPEEASMFADMLIAMNSRDAPAVAAAYDFTPFAHIVDIGGATGHILTTLLAAHAGPGGTIFDLAHNQAAATELIHARGMDGRVSFTVGSFFEEIPANADLYLMSHVIHDWSEPQCLLILANTRRAMSPTSKLLLVEMVLPGGNAFHPGKNLDITMLTLAGGQERNESEYRALLEKAGFHLTRVIPTDAAVSIIEAVPVA